MNKLKPNIPYDNSCEVVDALMDIILSANLPKVDREDYDIEDLEFYSLMASNINKTYVLEDDKIVEYLGFCEDLYNNADSENKYLVTSK